MAMMMMDRAAASMPMMGSMGAAMPTAPAASSMVMPRCTIKMEKCEGGMKMFFCCDDDLACATLQNLCKMMCDGMCSMSCMMNGMCVCQCNFTMCHCTCECTKDGVCITCTSGDAECCKMVQACCECMAQCMACGCTCCLCFNGTPVCCGCC